MKEKAQNLRGATLKPPLNCYVIGTMGTRKPSFRLEFRWLCRQISDETRESLLAHHGSEGFVFDNLDSLQRFLSSIQIKTCLRKLGQPKLLSYTVFVVHGAV